MPRFLKVAAAQMGPNNEGASREEIVERMLALLEQGKLHPVVDSTFPLKEAVQAQQRMLDRKQFGKIVLVP